MMYVRCAPAAEDSVSVWWREYFSEFLVEARFEPCHCTVKPRCMF